MWNTIPELRDLILSGHDVTPKDLDKLIQIARRKKETLYIEVKHALVLDKKKSERVAIIRKYTSGFANANGGIFIIGIDESKDWEITSCPSKMGGADLDQWAKDCNTSIAYMFSPPPDL